MTTPPAAPQDVWERLTELQTQAATALLKASRLTRPYTIVAGGEHVTQEEPIDFAELVTHVLATVAANCGGIEQLLSGRPGSWEADGVRQLLHSTVGYDEAELLRWRTEPVVVEMSIDQAILNGGHSEVYEPADKATEIIAIAERANMSPEEWVAQWDGREPVFRRWVDLLADGHNYDDEFIALDDRHGAAYDELNGRYDAAPSDAYDAEAEALDRVHNTDLAALQQKWRRRYERYAAAFEAAVRAKATELGITVPIEFRTVTDPETIRDARDSEESADAVAQRLWEHAHETTPTSLLTTDEPDQGS